jgi:hypothetical protein
MNKARERVTSPARGVVQQFLDSFEEYPARHASHDFDTGAIVEQMMDPQSR